MIRRLSAVVLLALGLALAPIGTAPAAGAPEQGQNPIVNPSFELDANHDGIPDGWTIRLRGGAASALDESVANRGQRSVRFTLPPGGSAELVTGIFPVPANRVATVTAARRWGTDQSRYLYEQYVAILSLFHPGGYKIIDQSGGAQRHLDASSFYAWEGNMIVGSILESYTRMARVTYCVYNTNFASGTPTFPITTWVDDVSLEISGDAPKENPRRQDPLETPCRHGANSSQ
jgi:hypothetical protein